MAGLTVGDSKMLAGQARRCRDKRTRCAVSGRRLDRRFVHTPQLLLLDRDFRSLENAMLCRRHSA